MSKKAFALFILAMVVMGSAGVYVGWKRQSKETEKAQYEMGRQRFLLDQKEAEETCRKMKNCTGIQ